MLPTRVATPVVPDFTPVPRRLRSDGWTEARQRGFIACLATTGSVAVAADSVGLCVSGAYKLRSEPGGASFARAWDQALDAGIAALKTVAFDRAVNGVPVTLFYHGEPAATTTRHDNRLLMSLLRHYDRPGSTATAPGGPYEPSTDTATIMWLAAIREIGKHEFNQVLYVRLLGDLLKLKRFPDLIDEVIWSTARAVRDAQVSLDHFLRIANEGPEGRREAAATVHHPLKPTQPTPTEQARADQALAYLRGQGPPLTVLRYPLPDGAPEIHVDPIPYRH